MDIFISCFQIILKLGELAFKLGDREDDPFLVHDPVRQHASLLIVRNHLGDLLTSTLKIAHELIGFHFLEFCDV